jgi:hypothetical protein
VKKSGFNVKLLLEISTERGREVENSPEGLQASGFVVVNPVLLCVAFGNIADAKIVRLIFANKLASHEATGVGKGRPGHKTNTCETEVPHVRQLYSLSERRGRNGGQDVINREGSWMKRGRRS